MIIWTQVVLINKNINYLRRRKRKNEECTGRIKKYDDDFCINEVKKTNIQIKDFF